MLAPSDAHAPSPTRGPAPLLGWQTLFLAYVLGVLAFEQLFSAFLGLGLLLAFDWPRLSTTRRIPALLCCFALGFGAGWISAPSRPELSPALQNALNAQGKQLIQGRVASVEGRPGRRLNILLQDAVLYQEPSTAEKEELEGKEAPNDAAREANKNSASLPLPGGLLWTWEHPAFWPEPGALVEARLRVIPAHGFANPGGWDYEAYLARAGVVFRGFGSDEKSPPRIVEPGDAPLWRLRLRVIKASLAAMGAQSEQDSLSPGRALLMTFLFGDRSQLDARTLDLMQRASLSHTLALSGQNLGYMVFTAWLLAYGIGLLCPGVFLRVGRPKLVVLLSAPLATLYLWLGGAPASLVRAYAMLVFWGVLLWRGSGRILLDGLFQALLCMLVFQPSLVFDLGLQLSAGAVAGLALYLDCAPLLRARVRGWGERTRAWLVRALRLSSDAQRQRALARALTSGNAPEDGRQDERRPRWSRALAWGVRGAIELFCLSLAAQAAILPLLVWTFGQLSPQLYLNVLWLPFQGFLIQPLGMLGLCLLPAPEAAGLVLGWAGDLLDTGVRALSWLDEADGLIPYIPLRPDWPAWIGYWTLLVWGAALLRHARGPRASRRPRAFLALAPALGLALLAWPTLSKTIEQTVNGVTLTLLDVGQGQAALLEYGGGRQALVDGGGLRSATFDVGAAVTTPALTRRSPPRLDLAILSHPDFDHARGLQHPLRVADARLFVWSGQGAGSKEMTNIQRIVEKRRIPSHIWTAGQKVLLSEELWIEVLHPSADFVSENTNESSLVLRLVWRGVGLALLPGDAGQRAMDQFLRPETEARLDAQVLILPHHGSGKELREELYERVTPELALASAGFRNQWGFPSARVSEALAARGIPLACTSERGAIVVRWSDPARRTVTTARRPPAR